ncbi:MAG TPA: protein-L-isoaspartate(D-aspartate) O-methyltransferase [Candidatus Eisenbacteria bacterium]|jgi:protein-L-isoaspartate(D-aspartate) O-methyltransferase
MDPTEFAVARRRMVIEQLRARGIHDPHVLRIMAAIPRHLFVDSSIQSRAYGDHALPIGRDQTISQPYMVGLMTQALALSGDEKVLEIGTGSGYQTAILAELADRVFTVERIPAIGLAARERLTAMGYSNIVYRIGDGSLGWRDMAPFDRVLITAGAPRVPGFLREQLLPGGHALVPVGEGENQLLLRVTRTPAGLRRASLAGCAFVPLIGREGFVDPSRGG